MSKSVAIIMRAFNEMPHVERALEMLNQQTYADFNLYAVDSGSTDGTFQTLEKQTCDLVKIRPDEYVPGKVLNDAVSRTTEELIVLLNADAIPQSTDWLETLILPILGNQADATFSKQIARPDAKFIVAYDYQRAYNAARIEPGFFSAVACAFRRGLWEQNKFRVEGYAEDVAWAEACIATGATFQLLEDSVVEHSHNYPLAALYRKRYRQALTFSEVPGPGKQIGRCLREIVRDFLFAIRRLRLHTIPYNVIYRITIARAVYSGMRAGKAPPGISRPNAC